MRERKCVKLKVNMYEDTKFKIIDMKPERDLIHYIWTRLITLAGKVNLEGNLYMSKNIPYTIETLAIEFNREANQIKLALDVFIELEMIELRGNNVYSVKNFAKHQNIKVKETVESKNKEEDINIKEVQIKEKAENEIYDNQNKEVKNKISENKVENVGANEGRNLEIDSKYSGKIRNKYSNKMDNIICDEKSKDNMPIVLEEKKNKRQNNKNQKETKKKNTIYFHGVNEETEDDEIVGLYEGDEGRPLKNGESVTRAWSF